MGQHYCCSVGIPACLILLQICSCPQSRADWGNAELPAWGQMFWCSVLMDSCVPAQSKQNLCATSVEITFKREVKGISGTHSIFVWCSDRSSCTKAITGGFY